MIRAGIAVGAAFAIAGCVAGDRIALLPAADGGSVGAVAVLAEDGEVELNSANQEARLSNGRPRVTQLAETRPEDASLIGQLPPGPISYSITGFATGEDALSSQQKMEVRRHMCRAEWREGCGELIPECTNPATGMGEGCPVPRPGYHVEIRGYTDTTGSITDNRTESGRRAQRVFEAMTEMGYVVDREDVLGMGKGPALRARADDSPPGILDETEDAAWRRVDILIR